MFLFIPEIGRCIFPPFSLTQFQNPHSPDLPFSVPFLLKDPAKSFSRTPSVSQRYLSRSLFSLIFAVDTFLGLSFCFPFFLYPPPDPPADVFLTVPRARVLLLFFASSLNLGHFPLSLEGPSFCPFVPFDFPATPFLFFLTVRVWSVSFGLPSL